MNKTGKIVVGVMVIALVVWAIVGNSDKKDSSSAQSTNEVFTIGAVFPLSGGTLSYWGETVKSGVEMALAEKQGIQVIYEDSKGTAQDGVSAFNVLQQKNVDLTFSLLSVVSVPLSKVAHDRKAPLLVSLSAASSTTLVNEYAVRYYTDPKNYVLPAMTSPISPVGTAQKIAYIYRNDEVGVSVSDEIKQRSTELKKTIVFSDSYKPGETDYTTILTKAKNSGAEVIVFNASAPGEAVAILKTVSRLGIKLPMVEASGVFADEGNRKDVAGIPFYSTAFDFSLDTPAARTFRSAYKLKYNKEPNFGAAFGYDLINIIDGCKTEKDVLACVRKSNSYTGLTGVANQSRPGDFVVTMHLEKVN